MREFQCKQCGRKQYSTARIEEQTNPSCRYCGAPASEIFETSATRDKPVPTPAVTVDKAMIAAHTINEYCRDHYYGCSANNRCPLGHLLSCYATEGEGQNPILWDIPAPEEIGLVSTAEAAQDIQEAIDTITGTKGR